MTNHSKLHHTIELLLYFGIDAFEKRPHGLKEGVRLGILAWWFLLCNVLKQCFVHSL